MFENWKSDGDNYSVLLSSVLYKEKLYSKKIYQHYTSNYYLLSKYKPLMIYYIHTYIHIDNAKKYMMCSTALSEWQSTQHFF